MWSLMARLDRGGGWFGTGAYPSTTQMYERNHCNDQWELWWICYPCLFCLGSFQKRLSLNNIKHCKRYLSIVCCLSIFAGFTHVGKWWRIGTALKLKWCTHLYAWCYSRGRNREGWRRDHGGVGHGGRRVPGRGNLNISSCSSCRVKARYMYIYLEAGKRCRIRRFLWVSF